MRLGGGHARHIVCRRGRCWCGNGAGWPDFFYLGAMAASYSAYDAASQSDVRIFYRRRAWWAFSGIVISLTAAALGLIAKSTESLCVAVGAAALLFAAFLWAIITALFTVWSIR